MNQPITKKSKRPPGPLDNIEIKPLPDDWWEQRQRDKEIAEALGDFGEALAALGSNVARYMEISDDPVRAIYELEKSHNNLYREAGHAIRSTAIYR